MKQITIKKLQITNFKGIENLEVEFQKQTNILGANGTGKTSVFDAFTWLLFGKDSTERKDFNIKNTVKTDLNRKEHEVSAILLVDDVEIKLKRVFKEKWQKTRGSEFAEFKGNETEFYFNEVPVNQTEYTAKINAILPELVFKMITSPTFFNSDSTTTWGWKNRRDILTKLAGEKTDIELINEMMVSQSASELQSLIDAINQNKSIDEYKAQIQSSVKKAKEDLKAIPTRIDEVLKGMPEQTDFSVIEKQIEDKSKELTDANNLIDNANKSFEAKLASVRDEKIRINNLQSEIDLIESNAKKEAQNKLQPDNSKLDSLVARRINIQKILEGHKDTLAHTESKILAKQQRIGVIEQQRNEKRDAFHKINAEEFEFDESASCCPTCKREFDADVVESKKTELLSNFRTDQTRRLEKIKSEGLALKAEQEELELKVKTEQELVDSTREMIETEKKNLQSIIDEIDTENTLLKSDSSEVDIDSLVSDILAKNDDYQNKLIMLQGMKDSLVEAPEIDNSELIAKRNELIDEIDLLKQQIHAKNQIESAKKRVAELKEEEKKLAQQVANVEKLEFAIQNFEKFKADKIEESVNQKFKMVTFRMFETQINGGLKATCEALVNGVPFSDANTASKINAGIDVINTLCDFYGVTAPIFCDNRESVTDIIDTNSQLISLVVSPKHTKLTVEN
jgi:DNA repair exonuclease SbcCD ATPase subunit